MNLATGSKICSLTHLGAVVLVHIQYGKAATSIQSRAMATNKIIQDMASKAQDAKNSIVGTNSTTLISLCKAVGVGLVYQSKYSKSIINPF